MNPCLSFGGKISSQKKKIKRPECNNAMSQKNLSQESPASRHSWQQNGMTSKANTLCGSPPPRLGFSGQGGTLIFPFENSWNLGAHNGR